MDKTGNDCIRYANVMLFSTFLSKAVGGTPSRQHLCAGQAATDVREAKVMLSPAIKNERQLDLDI
jgi:hypothetical protein